MIQIFLLFLLIILTFREKKCFFLFTFCTLAFTLSSRFLLFVIVFFFFFACIFIVVGSFSLILSLNVCTFTFNTYQLQRCIVSIIFLFLCFWIFFDVKILIDINNCLWSINRCLSSHNSQDWRKNEEENFSRMLKQFLSNEFQVFPIFK